MLKTLVFGLLSTASALRGMRTREQSSEFLDMFDAAVEDKSMEDEKTEDSPKVKLESRRRKHQAPAPAPASGGHSDESASGYNYYNPGQAQSGGSSPYGYGSSGGDQSPYYYGGSQGSGYSDPSSFPGIVDKDWQRPWNIINGACSEANIGKKHAMEIKSVGGGSYYLGIIDIGTPKQPLNMILDTGSDEIVIKGKGCQGCSGYGYDMTKSSTGVNDTQGPNKGLSAFAYGSGPVACQRVNDTVHLGDFQGDGLGIQVIVDTTISFFQQDDEGALHAIVGMAPGMKEYVGNTLSSVMEVRTFSECLPKNPEENGFFVVNDDRAEVKERHGFNGPFRGVGTYYWAAAATGLRMEWDHPVQKYKNTEKRPLYSPEQTIVAIVDTGTSLLSFPQSVMDAINEALQELQFDCSRMKELPKMKFEIEGVTHFLAPEDYVAISDGSMYGLYQKMGVKDGLAMNKLFFHQPGKPQFIDKVTGHECMLLFTSPLNQESPEGEMAILGMPFFREYEISFDFCTKEMFTKRSPGDCHHVVGQRPSNVQYCSDKDWFACWLEGWTQFFESFFDGLMHIFSPSPRHSVDKNERVAQTDREIQEYKVQKLKPETLQLSSAARSLLQSSSKGGMVSI